MKKWDIVLSCFLVMLISIFVGMMMGVNTMEFWPSASITIAGKAYVDANQNHALDYNDFSADGLKVTLQKHERKGDAPAITTIVVDETVVKNGEYRFKILGTKKGEYLVDVVFQSGIYQLTHNTVFYVGSNPFKVEGSKTILGPIILLANMGEKG